MEWNKKEKNEARKKALSNVNNSIYAHMPSYESAVLIKKIIKIKTKPKLIKIKTRKTNLYPQDKTIQIQAVMENGIIGLMNLTPIYFNQKKQYENDINGYIFETITKAKEYCCNNIERFI